MYMISRALHQPLVSVIMTVYNSESFLKEAIESILNQSYTNFELIIIDDCSSDQSVAVVKRYAAQDPRIRIFLNKKNQGQAASRNQGIRAAHGKYIMIADSDDISIRERFERQVAYMEEHPEIGVLGTQSLSFSTDPSQGKKSDRISYSFTEARVPVHNPTCCIRAAVLDKYGGFDPNNRIAEDIELYLRLNYHGVGFANLDQILCYYRERPGNLSHSKELLATKQMLKLFLNAGLRYKLRFTRIGYIRLAEIFLYILYLQLRIDHLRAVMTQQRKSSNV
jgi:glycosyltransferase involved in cell wall biosynthesis